MTNTRKIYYRNSLDLRDKVQVKVLRRRLKLSDGQLTTHFISENGWTGHSRSKEVFFKSGYPFREKNARRTVTKFPRAA
jgi:hypothetical protein